MFLDAAFAIMVSHFVPEYFGVSFTTPTLLFAFVSVFLPDSDLLYFAYQKYVLKKEIQNHRTFLHYPALYLLPALALSLYSPLYGTIFALCLLFHFIHDTLFLGWGVMWLWPYKKTRYKCFPDRYGKITSLPLVSWEEDEEKELIKKYHNPHWVRDFYLRVSIVSVIEYSALVLVFILYIT